MIIKPHFMSLFKIKGKLQKYRQDQRKPLLKHKLEVLTEPKIKSSFHNIHVALVEWQAFEHHCSQM